MSTIPPDEMERHLPGYEVPAGELGVMDALRMGWRQVMSDFWPVWILGLVAYAVNMGASLPGAVPYIGACFQLAILIFVLSPLAVGFFYALARAIDGRGADAGKVFEGFRQRYWQSVVAVLLPLGIYIGTVLVLGALVGLLAAMADGDEDVVVLLALLIAIPSMIVLCLVMLLFFFVPLTVWDHPESGWEAMKTSVRLVKEHYLSTLGFAVLAWLISLAATVVGFLACCVGVFFTAPFFMVWIGAATVYLYRSWTGRPLTQPVDGAPPEPAPPETPSSSVPRGSPFPPRDAMPPTPPDLVGGPGPGE